MGREPVFVGRERALAWLNTALDRAIAGQGACALVAGEAGIGKTALVDRLAVTAARAGVRVLRADCWPGEDQLPYWPLVQLVRPVAAELGWDRVSAVLGAETKYLEWLLPERAGGGAPLWRAGRFPLFDAVTRVLVETAREPTLVVVEDLHWADAGVLGFVEFHARQLRDVPMLVVGTYRDVGGEPAEALTGRLPTLLRLGSRIELSGLDVDEVALLLREVTGREPDRAWAARVHRRSGGNPLFAGEVARLMLAGAPDDVPDEVRYVIGQRLAGFPAEVTDLLEMAAVLGVEFDPRELARMAGLPVTQVRFKLEQARRQRVLTEEGDRLRFLHALVRDTLYERIPLPDRVDRHRAAGEAIAGLGQAARLAYHFAHGDRPQWAVEHSVRAGREAMRSFAYEDAAGHFQRALAMLDGDGERCELLLELAEAYRCAGTAKEAAEAGEAALELATTIGDAETVARATLACCTESQLWQSRPWLVERLTEALAGLPDRDSRLRVQVSSALAQELYLDPTATRRRAVLAQQAVAMARRLGDPAALAEALSCYHSTLFAAEDVESRLSAAAEVIELGAQSGDADLLLEGWLWRFIAMLELGDRDGAGRALLAYQTKVEQHQRPLWRCFASYRAAMLARTDGRFAEAEALARQSEEWGYRGGMPELATVVARAQLARLAVDRGDRASAEVAVREFTDLVRAQPPYPAHTHCAAARLDLALGVTEPARACLDRYLADGTDSIAAQPAAVATLVYLAEIACLLGADEYLPTLRDALRPHATRIAVSAAAVQCLGPVAETLGLIAARLGQLAEADAWFTEALRLARRMGARPWQARILLHHARLLHDHDRPRALDHAAAACREATALGMHGLATEAQSLLPGQSTGTASLRRDGEYWTLEYRGSTLHLRHAKGLRYLAELLSRPDREIHALQLAATTANGTVDGAGWALLDDSAKAAYRRRLVDLREQLAEAERHHDLGRADAARQEIDALTRELARAVGLGGRDRPAGSVAERARLNVTRALKGSIGKISAASPELGHHLRTTVHTGTFCRYDPGPAPGIAWRIDAR